MFIKHLFRDIRRAVHGPLLILATLILSVAVAVTAFGARNMFAAHADALSLHAQQMGDVLVTLRGDSAVRYLFAEDARELLGDRGEVLGEFRLSAPVEGKEDLGWLSVSAVDIAAADAFYDFTYTAYGSFTAQNLNESVILSETAARRAGVTVGDSLTVTLLSERVTYTVQAVARGEGLLTERDMLISLRGVLRLLSEKAPVIATLGDSFAPCTQLMIHADDPAAVRELLLADSAFSDKQITLSSEESGNDFLYLVQTVAVWIVALLLFLLSALLIATCLRLLQMRRRREYALFAAAGADRRRLHSLQYLEGGIYALAGALGGVALSYPLMRGMGSLFAWQTEPLTPTVTEVVFGFLFSPALIGICTYLHLRRQRTLCLAEQLGDAEAVAWHTGGTERGRLLLPVSTAAALLAVPLSPLSLRYYPAAVGMVLLPLSVYRVAPLAVRGAARLLDGMTAGCGRLAGWLRLCFKNLKRQTGICHAGGLFAVLMTLLLSAVFCQQVIERQLELLDTTLTADYVVAGASPSLEREIDADEAVAGSADFGMYSRVELPNGYTVNALSVSGDVEQCVSSALLPATLPRGQQVSVPETVAAVLDVSIGDTLSLKWGGNTYALTVVSYLPVSTTMILWDAPALGLAEDLLCIRLAEGLTEAETESFRLRMSEALEAQGAHLADAEAVYSTVPATLQGFLRLLVYAELFALLLTLTGICNTLVAQYRNRREEWRLLRMAGMTRSALRGMVATELVMLFLIAALCATLAYGGMRFFMDAGMRSFGVA